MDQNEEKSVWLKLILPICLGIFAAAIYHNAIKTQKVSVDVWVAQKSIDPNMTITSENWNENFQTQTIAVHKETPQQFKTSFKSDWLKLTTKKAFNEGEYVFPTDFNWQSL